MLIDVQGESGASLLNTSYFEPKDHSIFQILLNVNMHIYLFF